MGYLNHGSGKHDLKFKLCFSSSFIKSNKKIPHYKYKKKTIEKSIKSLHTILV